MDNGYRGCISVKDEFYEESGENEYIKDYGMAVSYTHLMMA